MHFALWQRQHVHPFHESLVFQVLFGAEWVLNGRWVTPHLRNYAEQNGPESWGSSNLHLPNVIQICHDHVTWFMWYG